MNDGGSLRSHRAFSMGAGVAIIGGVVLVAGMLFGHGAAAASYLVAYSAAVAVVVGMLLLIMIAHLSGAIWFVLLRRQAEAVVAALPALAVLALPLLLFPRAFWPWAAPFDELPPAMQETLRPKLAYLHPAFFAARTVLYWVVWIAAGELLRRASQRQDASSSGSAKRIRRADPFQRVSVVGLLLGAPALTFASFDWMMSLSPEWSSSVYGVYYFAWSIAGALALLAVLARNLEAYWAPTKEHFEALGRLTLAFVLFWAYLWYVQFFIIWIADIPGEITWYLVRLSGGWRVLSGVIVVAAFVVPFLVLAFRAARGSVLLMPAVGVCILIAHYLDVYWLIVPSMRPAWTFGDLIWDAAAVAFVVGTVIAVIAWRQAAVPAVASGDPQFASSLVYEAR